MSTISNKSFTSPRQRPDSSTHFIDQLSPTDQIKRDIIQLAREATSHLAKSWDDNAEKYAFTVKVRVMSIRLQNFTPLTIREWLRDKWREEKDEINMIEATKQMSEENKKLTKLRVKYESANEIFDTFLMVLHNSPLVEMRAGGEIQLEDPRIVERIRKRKETRGGTPVLGIRKDDDDDEEEDTLDIQPIDENGATEDEEFEREIGKV